MYIRSEKDVLKVVNTLIVNTKGEGEKSAEDFWVKAERLLYCALIGYIWYEAPAEEMNFTTLLELINASEAREDDEEYQSPVDLLFADLEERSPDHFAVKQYKKYKLAAGKTAKSILISCGARLAPFDIEELRELMSYDELELDTLGDRKTALFLIMSDTDDTFNFVIAILQSQLFNLLCDKADDEYNGKLPIHVRFLLDEFANIGQIPRFDKLIATIRSREMSASIILQSQSQLKAIYKDAAEIILDNADSTLFLGGRGKNAKDISDNLGRETIDSFNTSENRGTQVSHGLTYQKLGKELMTQDEIAVMDGGKCILQLRGVRPFLSDKYDITKHPNYKYLSDFDKRNAFDVERYMSTRPAIVKPDEAFDIYEIDLSDEDAAADKNGGRRGITAAFSFSTTFFEPHSGRKRGLYEFFNSAVGVLQTLVIALAQVLAFGVPLTSWRVTATTIRAQMLMVNKEAQQNRTRTVSPAAIPSKANYRVKSKKHL